MLIHFYEIMDHLNTNHDLIEDLQNRLSLMTQERDSAMEMWKLAEIVAHNAREEIKAHSSLSKVESLKKEMETMQQDYSDAIKLLEFKLKSLDKDLKFYRNKSISADEEIHNLQTKISFMEEDKKEIDFNFKRLKEEKESIEKELRQAQKRFDEAAHEASQARGKVKDALIMAQDALSNEANLLEEKENLEKRLSESVDEFESKLEKEIDSIKTSLNARIESLTNQLQTAITDKNQLSLEYESLRAEYNLKLQEASLKYNSTIQELQAVRTRRQHEMSQWSEEREVLRKQVLSLQAELEQHLLELRQKESAQCENCSEMKLYLEKYRLLAKEWEEAAFCVTREFEKYNMEVNKLKASHSCEE